MKNLVFILLTFYSTINYACICQPPSGLKEAQKNEFLNSNDILIAEVIKISSNNKTVTIVVKEVFKGQLIVGTEISFNNNLTCEPFIDTLGDWLIYSESENGNITLNQCGLSRSLKNPERNRYFAYLPPPPKLNKPVKQNRDSKKMEKLDAILETEKELKNLKKKK